MSFESIGDIVGWLDFITYLYNSESLICFTAVQASHKAALSPFAAQRRMEFPLRVSNRCAQYVTIYHINTPPGQSIDAQTMYGQIAASVDCDSTRTTNVSCRLIVLETTANGKERNTHQQTMSYVSVMLAISIIAADDKNENRQKWSGSTSRLECQQEHFVL